MISQKYDNEKLHWNCENLRKYYKTLIKKMLDTTSEIWETMRNMRFFKKLKLWDTSVNGHLCLSVLVEKYKNVKNITQLVFSVFSVFLLFPFIFVFQSLLLCCCSPCLPFLNSTFCVEGLFLSISSPDYLWPIEKAFFSHEPLCAGLF